MPAKLLLRRELRCTNRQFEISSRTISSDGWSYNRKTMEVLAEFVEDRIIPHPPQSPDFNVLEDRWSYLDRKAKTAEIKTISGLKSKLTQLWDEMDWNIIRRPVNSMGARLAECEKLQGARTHY